MQISGSGQRLRGELRMQDGQAPEVTRFIFHDLEVFDLPTAALGVGQSLPIAGVLGVSLLQNFAVRLSYVAGAITLKDEIPDSNEELASDCAATLLLGPAAARPSCLGVFNAVPVGGGLVEVGGDSIELPASRLVVPLCLAADPFDPTPPAETGPAQQSGVSANAVVATGQGISLISRSAVERLRVAGARLTEQPPVTVFLPAGPETAPIVEIERVAAVSNETIELGPCGELARRRRLLVAGRQGIPAWDRDRSGASVAQVLPAIRFAVLEDNRPLIQGLRQELAPFVGDIDVVLGGSFLRHFEVDLDYRANRVILQCAEGQAAGTCEVLPFCSSSGDPRCPDRVAQ